MRRAVWLYLLFSLAAFGQDCTTYVVVGAFDRTSGDDIDHLKADDFQARMSGRILSVVSAAQNFNSRLLVLMETDGLAKNDKLGDEINLATRIARQAPEGKPVAFGVYAGRAVFTKGFISETEPRARAISDVREEGGSLGKKVALYDSLLHGLELFGPHQPGDTVLLIGDPYDDGSRHSDSDVEKEFLRTGTRFLVVLRQDLSRVSRDFLWNNHEREKEFFSELPRQNRRRLYRFQRAFSRHLCLERVHAGIESAWKSAPASQMEAAVSQPHSRRASKDCSLLPSAVAGVLQCARWSKINAPREGRVVISGTVVLISLLRPRVVRERPVPALLPSVCGPLPGAWHGLQRAWPAWPRSLSRCPPVR